MSDIVMTTEEVEEEKAQRFRQMKKEASERYRKRREEERVAGVESAKNIINWFKSTDNWDKLSEDAQNFLTGFLRPRVVANKSMLTVLFGESPKVGDTFTLSEAFQKTLKGKSNIDFYVKRWAAKGILVSYSQDNENILNSTYRLETLPEGTFDEEEDEDDEKTSEE